MNYLFWLILTVIFTIVEFIVPSLVTIWFAIGATITIFISFITENINIQIVCFTITSLLALIFIRHYAKRIFSKKIESFNSASLDADIVIEKIISIGSEEKIYDVKYKGAIWTAISNDLFEVGDKATIKKFKGNKIIITK